METDNNNNTVIPTILKREQPVQQFKSELLAELIAANEKLGIREEMNIPKNRNLIFVYTSAKSGSTSLVSSLRLSCFEFCTVIHLHNDTMLKIMYQINNLTIQDIIEFNASLGKRVYVFDIFRHPVEHKLSLYFEILDTFHFNVNSMDIKNLTLDKIVTRFNKLYPHILCPDYVESVYKFQDTNLFDKPFDYDTGFLHLVDSNGVNYIKLRLMDSETKWAKILSTILKNNVWIVKDNVTSMSKRPMHKYYDQFKSDYKLPTNYFEELKQNPVLDKYLSPSEKEEYLAKWNKLVSDTAFQPFTDEQYNLYIEISRENKHITQCQFNHYLDNGCDCSQCSQRRANMRNTLKKGVPPEEIAILKNRPLPLPPTMPPQLPQQQLPQKSTSKKAFALSFLK